MAINFLRRPALVPVIAEARLLKLGKRLAYGEVLLFSEGEDEPVARRCLRPDWERGWPDNERGWMQEAIKMIQRNGNVWTKGIDIQSTSYAELEYGLSVVWFKTMAKRWKKEHQPKVEQNAHATADKIKGRKIKVSAWNVRRTMLY